MVQTLIVFLQQFNWSSAGPRDIFLFLFFQFLEKKKTNKKIAKIAPKIPMFCNGNLDFDMEIMTTNDSNTLQLIRVYYKHKTHCSNSTNSALIYFAFRNIYSNGTAIGSSCDVSRNASAQYKSCINKTTFGFIVYGFYTTVCYFVLCLQCELCVRACMCACRSRSLFLSLSECLQAVFAICFGALFSWLVVVPLICLTDFLWLAFLSHSRTITVNTLYVPLTRFVI